MIEDALFSKESIYSGLEMGVGKVASLRLAILPVWLHGILDGIWERLNAMLEAEIIVKT